MAQGRQVAQGEPVRASQAAANHQTRVARLVAELGLRDCPGKCVIGLIADLDWREGPAYGKTRSFQAEFNH